MRTLLLHVFFFSVCTAAVFFCGCNLLPEPAENVTRYFDLGLPAKTLKASGGSVTVLPFTSSSGERYRMVYRKNNLLCDDDDNKWQMPPGSLITKYLTLIFSDAGTVRKDGKCQNFLSGNVTAFEADKGDAVLGLRYRIRRESGSGNADKVINRSLLLREKIKGDSASDFASAMGRAAERAAELILRDIDSK